MTVATRTPRPVTPTGILARELDELSTLLGATPGADPGVAARLRRAAGRAEQAIRCKWSGNETRRFV